MARPRWLSAWAFAVAALLTAISRYGWVADTGFSTEGVVYRIATAAVGGVVWGAVITWVVKKSREKIPKP